MTSYAQLTQLQTQLFSPDIRQSSAEAFLFFVRVKYSKCRTKSNDMVIEWLFLASCVGKGYSTDIH